MGGQVVGDLRTVLSLEDYEYVTGMRNAAKQSQQLGGALTGGLGRAIGQVGFAAQDFSSVLSMGGKNALGRALMGTMNNVQVLGSAFGPMGMAISSVAGALGSIFIPKLFESGEASQKLADDLKSVTSEAEKMNAEFARRARAGAGIGKLSSSKAAGAHLEDLGLEQKILRDRQKRLEKAGDDMGSRLWDSRKAGLPEWAVNKDTATKLRNLQPIKEGEKLPELDEAKKLADELDAVQAKLSEIGREQDATKRKQTELFESEQYLRGVERENKKQKQITEELTKQSRIWDQIRKQAQSPFEAAREKLDELQQALRKGTIGKDLYDEASGKVMEDYEKAHQVKYHESEGAHYQNAALAAGSSEAISAATRAQMKQNDPRLQLARKQAQLARDQVEELRKIKEHVKNMQPPVPVRL